MSLDRQAVLARNYGLSPQLSSLNYCHLCKEPAPDDDTRRRWVLADLSRDDLQSLQKAAGEKQIGQQGWQGFLEEVGNINFSTRVCARRQWDEVPKRGEL